MPKLRTKSGIGIELTGDRINLVKLSRSSEGVVLNEARSIKLPAGKKSDEKNLLAAHMGRAFEGVDFSKDEIALGVGGHMSFVRKVKLPPVSQSKLKQVVSFEVQQQVPFSLDEVIWDYQIISQISKTPGPVEVLIAAIKKSFVEDLLKILQDSTKKTPETVDIASLALHNSLAFNGLLHEERVGILVNLGFGYTDVSIESKGNMAFTRAVPIGRRNILRKITDARGVEMSQAEEILSKGEDISSIILPVWEDLVAEIKRTTNYYLSQVEKVTHFQYIYLAGEIPQKDALTKLLKNSFRADIEQISPFGKITHSPSQLTSDAGNFCVSTGLALRAIEQFPVEMNLLPPRILHSRQLANKRLYFISSLVVLFLMSWILLVLGTRNYNLIKEKINIIEPIIKNYKPYVAKTEELRSERQKVTNNLKNIEKVLKQKSQLSDILLEVSELTPSSIYITQISTSELQNVAGRISRDMSSSRRVPSISREEIERTPSRKEPDVAGRPARGAPGRELTVRTEKEPVAQQIYLSGITDSYPSVDSYIKALKSSLLFETVEIVSVASASMERASSSLSRTGIESIGRPSSRRTRETSEEIVEEEKVQFTLQIGLGK